MSSGKELYPSSLFHFSREHFAMTFAKLLKKNKTNEAQSRQSKTNTQVFLKPQIRRF